MSTIASHHDPNSSEETDNEKIWRDATQVEFNAMIRNDTWELVEFPLNKKDVIG
jgi:hypothetical protein